MQVRRGRLDQSVGNHVPAHVNACRGGWYKQGVWGGTVARAPWLAWVQVVAGPGAPLASAGWTPAGAAPRAARATGRAVRRAPQAPRRHLCSQGLASDLESRPRLQAPLRAAPARQQTLVYWSLCVCLVEPAGSSDCGLCSRWRKRTSCLAADRAQGPGRLDSTRLPISEPVIFGAPASRRVILR